MRLRIMNLMKCTYSNIIIGDVHTNQYILRQAQALHVAKITDSPPTIFKFCLQGLQQEQAISIILMKIEQ